MVARWSWASPERIACTPPALDIQYQFAASLDAQGQAEFKAWLSGFRVHLSAMLAASGRAGLVANAAVSLQAAARDVLPDVFATLQASGDLKAQLLVPCAVLQLADVPTLATRATGSIEVSVSAVTNVSAAVGG